MFSHNGRISERQVMILLILQMFNTNTLLLPKVATGFVGRNGYLLSILSIFIGIIFVYCITTLTMKFPGMTFVELSAQILPQWVAYSLSIIFAIKLVVGTGLELRMVGELILQVMLPRTPLIVIMLAMLLTCSYLVKSGIESTARMGEVLTYFVFIPLIIVLVVIALNITYGEVLPLFQTNIKSVVSGTVNISYEFVPVELMLMMTGLMRKPNKARKVSIIAVVIIGVLQTLITLFTVCEIGLGETQRHIWPVLALMQSIGINNSVVENQEVLLLIVWILSIFMSVGTGLYFSSLIGSRSYKFKRENIFILPLVPIVLLVASFPRNSVKAYEYYLKFQYYFGIWFTIIVPLVLLIIASLRRESDAK